ncbi:hypothetical protein FKM82_015058 [Ascaphus truei]
MEVPLPPDDQELRNVIDKLAQFVARNGPEFENMTMEKQKENPKFSFLFGGEFYNYYKCKLAMEQQQQLLCKQAQDLEAIAQIPTIPTIPPPTLPLPPALVTPQGAPPIEDLIQQSQWNLQQQEQQLLVMRQEEVTAVVTHAMEQQVQKLRDETQLDMNEFDNLLQPIIDTCTKDAISAGKNWMFSNAKTPQHCELMSGHLRDRITADGAHFELRLHLIYLTNDVLHHCQRKQARELLAALQKVVVPLYCTSFLAVEEDKQQKIARLLQLWEKNGYFDEATIQQLQSPALGLGQHQEVIPPLAMPSSPEFEPPPGSVPDPTAGGTRVPVAHDQIPPNKIPWFDQPQPIAPWGQQQPPCEQPPFPHHPTPPPCPPWNNSHEGMWNEQRDPNWNSQREAPWNNQPEPAWNNQFEAPWNNQHEQPPWGTGTQREPHFRMQRPPHFRGPFPPHQQHPPQFNQPPPPHNFHRFPPRFMQDEFPPRHPFERPPFPHRFDYPQGDFPAEMGPPHHHQGHRMPHPNMNEHPPWGGPQHQEFGGPPPHGFNGQPPHMRRQGPPHVNHDDPSLVPNVPYFDLPAGLMAPLVKLEDYDYKPLDPKDIRLPPPMPPSERLLAAVEAFYSPPSHDRPRNSEGWEQNGLYEFFRAKMRSRRRKGQGKRNSRPSRSQSRSKSRGHSSSRSNSGSSKSSRSYSRSRSGSRSRSRSYSRSRSRTRSRSSHSRSRSRSRSKSVSPGRKRRSRSRSATPPSSSGLGSGSGPPVPNVRLGEENKGHQMLVKMGWSGAGGLGANEQGIQDPIKGGDIRDKWDQYKGVGVSLDDPYENYRRNKSYSFIARMKARDENFKAGGPFPPGAAPPSNPNRETPDPPAPE